MVGVSESDEREIPQSRAEYAAPTEGKPDRKARIRSYYERNPEMMVSPLTAMKDSKRRGRALIEGLVGPVKDKRVLDLGCGRGTIGDALIEWGAAQYVGVDLVDAGFAKTEHKRFLCGDVEDPCLRIEERDFDLVVILDVMEHLWHPRASSSSAGARGAP